MQHMHTQQVPGLLLTPACGCACPVTSRELCGKCCCQDCYSDDSEYAALNKWERPPLLQTVWSVV